MGPSHSLFNPNQFCNYGINFWDDPYDKERGLKIEVNDEVTIPMQVIRTKILFQTRSPIRHELSTCPCLQLTSQREWNPGQIQLGGMHSAKLLPKYQVSNIETYQQMSYEYLDPSSNEALIHQTEPSYIDMREKLISQLQSTQCNIDQV